MNKIFFLIMSGIIGAVCGSFLNVCIYRMPRDKSLVFPGSFCPHCNTSIHWYDNIPLVSYLLLQGKCRSCQKRISFRYPLVEVITGVLFIITFLRWYPVQLWPVFFIRDIFVLCSLVAVFFIDLDFKIIPNEITYFGVLFAFVLNGIFPGLIGARTILQALIRSALGLIVGGGILLILGIAGEKLFKKEAMGMGDVKLLAMFGSFYGFLPAILIIIIGSFIGALVGGCCLLLRKLQFGQQIPFGPFLAIACFIVIFWGETLVRLYLNIVLAH